jgi:hypothetical protein
MSVLAKIDIRPIWTNHLSTLKNEQTGKTSVGDLFVFFAIPLIVAGGTVWLNVYVSDSALAILTNALAILAGLLFNLLVLLHTVKWPEDHPQKNSLLRLAKESYNNIAHSIVVSLLTLVFLVTASNYPSRSSGRLILGTIAICLVVHFGLTMFMVLKRMHAMLHTEFSSRQ